MSTNSDVQFPIHIVNDETLGAKPYLIRAFLDYIYDIGEKPFVHVYRKYPGVYIPTDDEERTVLNLSIDAIRNLHTDKRQISFDTRFGGVSHQCIIPIGAIIAVVSDKGKGSLFPVITLDATPDPIGSNNGTIQTYPAEVKKPSKGRPSLKVVK